MPSFGKRTPFTEEHLKPFEKVYGKKSDGTSKRTEGEWSFGAEQVELDQTAENKGVDEHLAHSRWRCFSREWITTTKGDSLDISWLKDKDSVDAANLPEPEVLAREAKGELEAALAGLEGLLRALQWAN